MEYDSLTTKLATIAAFYSWLLFSLGQIRHRIKQIIRIPQSFKGSIVENPSIRSPFPHLGTPFEYGGREPLDQIYGYFI